MRVNDKKKRLIPVILIKNGWVVQSESFKIYKNIGHPIPTIKRLSEFGSDELIILDISKDEFYEKRREDMNYTFKTNFLQILQEVSNVCYMPISVGGKIRSLKDAEDRIKNGAEKVVLNNLVINDHNEVKKIVKNFGSQAVIGSIDFISDIEKSYKVFSDGKKITNIDPIELSKKLVDIGVGEIFVNSVDRDGKKNGYDTDYLKKFCDAIDKPVIVCGGAGSWQHMYDVFLNTKCDGIAAANIFHHIEHSVYLAKDFLSKKSNKFREAKFYYD